MGIIFNMMCQVWWGWLNKYDFKVMNEITWDWSSAYDFQSVVPSLIGLAE